MSMSQESLQNLLFDMDAQLQKNQQDLQLVSSQISQKEMTSRITTLTLKELSENGSANDTVWEGCGKMFLSTDIKEFEDRVEEDNKTLKEQLKALGIKRDYLKTSVEKTAQSMKAILTGKQ